MKLYLLRHAFAAKRDGIEDDDHNRPLTPKGIKKMHQNAKGMKVLGLSFDLILSSPYLRAKQTAEIVLQDLKIENNKIAFTKNLIPGASFEKLIREINTRFLNATNILLVGHEPHLTQLISFLLTGGTPIPITFKKGSLCQLSIQKLSESECAVLDWLLLPSQLRFCRAPSV
jgi:phosphohistidine phosphatase